jgi:hypothetical protein
VSAVKNRDRRLVGPAVGLAAVLRFAGARFFVAGARVFIRLAPAALPRALPFACCPSRAACKGGNRRSGYRRNSI